MTAFGYVALAASLIACGIIAFAHPEMTQVQLQKACAATCKAGVETFEYHGSSDFKCVCAEPLGVTPE